MAISTPQSRANRKVYDVVVVGAGVIGLAIGRRSAQRGLRTLVLDAGEAAHGATRVAAGMLAPVSEADFGEQDLLALNLEAARRYPDFVAELEDETGVPTGYRPCGTLAVALDRDDAAVLKRLYSFQRSLALEPEWLTGRECRTLEPGLAPSVAGGIRSAIDHQVRPRPLAEALVRALERSGGELRQQAPVAALETDGEQMTGVLLESGERIAAGHVVVAAGWQAGSLGGLPPDALVPIRPVKGQILRLRGSEQSLPRRVVRTLEVYIVPRQDGELVIGATVEERGPDRAVTAGGLLELLREAYEALPGVTEFELVEASAGLRPAAPDNRPVVGAGAVPGLVWATGHWRNGILLAPLSADAVTDIVTGAPAPTCFAAFSPERFSRRAAKPVLTAAAGGEES